MALSPRGTLSVETLDRSDSDLLDEEPWQATCEILPEPDIEHSMDVILVGSSELSAPASPRPCRDLLAYEVKVNQRDIEDMCICCGSFQVHTQHPLFEGGMCAPCKDKFLDCLFLYDDDGYQSYCSICCAGETLLICENPDCTRCYCFECVDTLVGPGTSGKVQAMSNWVCFLCLPFPRSGLLHRRRKWRGWLKAFCDRESENPLETYKTVPVWKREPVRVLSLFGNIRRELVSLGFLESGSAPGGLKHLDDVTDVVRRDVEGWGPFDLVYGSTPALGHACDHPPAWYLFQFHRVLQYARPRPGSQQPFFWMFVDNLVLSQDDQTVATRFLEVRAMPQSGWRAGSPPQGHASASRGQHGSRPHPAASSSWGSRGPAAVPRHRPCWWPWRASPARSSCTSGHVGLPVCAQKHLRTRAHAAHVHIITRALMHTHVYSSSGAQTALGFLRLPESLTLRAASWAQLAWAPPSTAPLRTAPAGAWCPPFSGRLPHAHSRKPPCCPALSPLPGYLRDALCKYRQIWRGPALLCSWLSPMNSPLGNPSAAHTPPSFAASAAVFCAVQFCSVLLCMDTKNVFRLFPVDGYWGCCSLVGTSAGWIPGRTLMCKVRSSLQPCLPAQPPAPQQGPRGARFPVQSCCVGAWVPPCFRDLPFCRLTGFDAYTTHC